MSGIHVLSDNLLGGKKLEKTSTPKGKDVAENSDNPAAIFAVMFSSFMGLNDSKGQKSSIAGQESEEMQSGENPVPSVQNPKGQGSMLGYGNFALLNFLQPMLKSDLPAGKEANSGNDVSQGTALLNQVSLVSDEVSAQSGMTTLKPQGGNPGNTELDKYRQVIANLLITLNGEITESSLKGNRLSFEGTETLELGQKMAKIIQGWLMVTDEVVTDGQSRSGKVTGGQAQAQAQAQAQVKVEVEVDGTKTSQEGNQIRTNSSSTQMINRLEALFREIGESIAPSAKVNLVSSESAGSKVTRQEITKIIENWMTATDEAVKDSQSRSGKVTGGQAQAQAQAQVKVEVEVEGTKTSQEGSQIRTNSSSTQMINRLETLFREIGESIAPSAKVNLVSSESAGSKVTRQEMTKIIENWMTETDEAVKDGQARSGKVTGGQAQVKVEVEGTKASQEGNQIRANSSSTQMINRLETLFREIGERIAPSSKVNLVSPESTASKVTHQEMAKIIENWMTATDEAVIDGQARSGHKEIEVLLDVLSAGVKTANPALSAKASTLLAALIPFLRQGTEAAKAPLGMNEMNEDEGSVLAPRAKGILKPLKQLNGTDIDIVSTRVKDTAFLTNAQQKSDGMIPTGNSTSNIFEGRLRDGIQKGDIKQSVEISGVKDVQNQNSSIGIGLASHILATKVADGKTTAMPVWEQISMVIREQVMNRTQELNRSQDLKQLDIQLRPADLGKIQIVMRLENGQVHLVLQASETATGHLLQNQLSELRQNLMNQGVNCGSMHMGQGGERQQQPQGDEAGRTFQQSNILLNEEEEPIPNLNPITLGKVEVNRINVTA